MSHTGKPTEISGQPQPSRSRDPREKPVIPDSSVAQGESSERSGTKKTSKAQKDVSNQPYRFALCPKLLGLDEKKFEEISKIKAFKKSRVHTSEHYIGVAEFEMSVRTEGPNEDTKIWAETNKWIAAWKKNLKNKDGEHEADFLALLMALSDECYTNLENIAMTVLVSVVLELDIQSRGELPALETIESAAEFLDRCSVQKYKNSSAPYKALHNLFNRYEILLIKPQ